MRELGKYLAIFGVASFGLHFFNYNLKLLMWIDLWGETVGMGIRAALVVVGGLLFFLGARPNLGEDEADEIEQEAAANPA